MTKEFFKAICKQNGIPVAIASKIVDARYKNGKRFPYLSNIDGQYYNGNDAWDAKTNALKSALINNSKEYVYCRLLEIK